MNKEIVHVVMVDDLEYVTTSDIDSLHKSWSSAAYRVKVLNEEFKERGMDSHAYYFMVEIQ